MDEGHKPLSPLQIAWEGIRLSRNNRKLITYVFLIALLTSCVLSLGNLLATKPLLTDLAAKSASIGSLDPVSPIYSAFLAAIKKDAGEIAATEVVFAVVAFPISVAVKTLIIYSSAVAYTQQKQTLGESLWMVKGMLRGPLLTQLLVSVLSLGYVALVALPVVLLIHISEGSVIVLLLAALLSVVAAIGLLYLSMVWSLSVTVSVIEHGRYGMEAIRRATELVQGRKWKGVAIFLFFLMWISVSPVPYLPQTAQGYWWLFSHIVYVEAVSFFMLGAFTVYYYECRRCLGDEDLCRAGEFVYSTLPLSEDVAGEVP